MFFAVTCHATKDATFFAVFVKYLAHLVQSDIKTNKLLNFINITCLLNLQKFALSRKGKTTCKEVFYVF
jgi:hypothetical protein